MKIQGIVYSRAMLESLEHKEETDIYELFGKDIPASVRASLEKNRLWELAGSYGDPSVGEPIEYDHLVLETDEGEIVLEVYNRGLMLFLTDDEELRRINRFLCSIIDHVERK